MTIAGDHVYLDIEQDGDAVTGTVVHRDRGGGHQSDVKGTVKDAHVDLTFPDLEVEARFVGKLQNDDMMKGTWTSALVGDQPLTLEREDD